MWIWDYIKIRNLLSVSIKTGKRKLKLLKTAKNKGEVRLFFMEAWGNERQSCEDTGHTSTTHKDMNDNQEAKMADSRDTQWMEKPFTPNTCFHKESLLQNKGKFSIHDYKNN